MSRIGICDDNLSQLRDLKEIIESSFAKHEGSYKIEAYNDSRVLLHQNSMEPFDALFLDIDMPKLDGFDIAKLLRNNFSHCLIVFVTVHSELVFDSFAFQPFNFIRKNYHIPLEESIPPVVDKLVLHLHQDDKVTLFDEYDRMHIVYIRDILYLEGDDHYVIYHLSSTCDINKSRMREKVSNCLEMYSSYGFVKIHKSLLVNLKHVTYIDKRASDVEMDNGEHLPITSRYKKDVEEKYLQYMRTKT